MLGPRLETALLVMSTGNLNPTLVLGTHAGHESSHKVPLSFFPCPPGSSLLSCDGKAVDSSSQIVLYWPCSALTRPTNSCLVPPQGGENRYLIKYKDTRRGGPELMGGGKHGLDGQYGSQDRDISWPASRRSRPSLLPFLCPFLIVQALKYAFLPFPLS